jgi:hypothetical protein
MKLSREVVSVNISVTGYWENKSQELTTEKFSIISQKFFAKVFFFLSSFV